MTYKEAIERLNKRRLKVTLVCDSEYCRKENEAIDIAIRGIRDIEDAEKEIEWLRKIIEDTGIVLPHRAKI